MRQTVRAGATPITLSEGDDAPLPVEFRIFPFGEVRCPTAGGVTDEGVYVFNERSAAEVMAAYAKGPARLPIDLNHGMHGPEIRPDSADARGWFTPEIRNGELWATAVTWTPDGERRLRERTQIYFSPTFCVNAETKEIVEIDAVALVARPATEGALALVAASKRPTMTASERATCIAALAILVRRELRASKTRATLERKR